MGRVLVSWSSGKDSCLALDELRRSGAEVDGLLTTVDERARVSHHGVPLAAVEAQAAALGLPLHVVEAPADPGRYAERMGAAMAAARDRGVDRVAFGDLHLADLRRWREERLAGAGLGAVFPLWGRPPAVLAREALDRGVEATVVAVDLAALPATVVGRRWDLALLAELPADVDPCGEHGELHTFVHHGPGFAHRVPLTVVGVASTAAHAHARVAPRPELEPEPEPEPERAPSPGAG